MDWAALMRVGLGILRLPPEVFWAMTPREFLAAAEPWMGTGAAPMGRSELDELRARFPDVSQEMGG